MSLEQRARLSLLPRRRGATTLVLITRERLVRADFTPGRAPTIKDLQQRLRPETDDLAMLVDTALRLGKKRPDKVFVLSSELWIQSVHMPADLARGLEEAELARALCFEAEPISGISAIDSQAGVVPLGSSGQQRDFWIVQAPNSELNQVDDAVYELGGRLQGLLHPAGVRHPLTPQLDSNWQRVELWSGAIVCTRHVEGAAPQVQVINSEPAQRGWQTAVDAWLKDAGPAQWLASEASFKAPVEGAEVFSLAHETSLRTWLTAWAEQLSLPSPGVPVIRPAVRPMSTAKRRAITAALATTAALGCFAHYTVTQRHIAELSSQTKMITAQVTSFEATKKQGTELTGKIDKARVKLDALSNKLADCQATLEAHRLRWENLLLMLAMFRPDDLLVQKIESTGDKLNISGLCLGPHPANELASELGTRVRELGWGVQPARQVSGQVLGSGEPWRFDLTLNDLPSGQIVSVATSGGTTPPKSPARPAPNPFAPPPTPRGMPIPRRPPSRVASNQEEIYPARMPSVEEESDEAQD